MNFQELGLPDVLVQELAKQGITVPTPIQNKTIPVALTGRDIMGSAQTGTGKTLAFALPALKHLMEASHDRALVLVPTRELAVQVHAVFESLLSAAKLPQACLIIGGVAIHPQIAALRRGPRVIVATPGRLIDHLRNVKYELKNINMLVLDEADRMLDMGFLPQVRKIMEFLPKERQTLFFTATFPKEVMALTKDILKNPEKIFVDPPSTANNLVEQKSLDATQANKRDLLLDAVNAAGNSVLVFARTKRRTDSVFQYLAEFDIAVDRIHGDRSQPQRQKAITDFRSGKTRVLVATDIAARGLDIPQVSLVVNYDLPECKEDYVHRIGRTGRAGATGQAISLVLAIESRHWQDISGQKHQRPKNVPEATEEESAESEESWGGRKRDFKAVKTERRASFTAARTARREESAEGRGFRQARPERDSRAPRRDNGASQTGFPGGPQVGFQTERRYARDRQPGEFSPARERDSGDRRFQRTGDRPAPAQNKPLWSDRRDDRASGFAKKPFSGGYRKSEGEKTFGARGGDQKAFPRTERSARPFAGRKSGPNDSFRRAPANEGRF